MNVRVFSEGSDDSPKPKRNDVREAKFRCPTIHRQKATSSERRTENSITISFTSSISLLWADVPWEQKVLFALY